MDKLVVDIDAITSNFNKKFDESIGKLKSGEKDFEKFGEKMSIFSAIMLAGGGAAIKYASDLQESMNKAEVTFGKSSDGVKDFAKQSLTSFGIAEGSALDMAAKFGDMATSMGLNKQQAAGMSTKLVGLAADLSSFKNIKLDVANTALTSIFTGETESLKGLGVVMTEANLKTFAMSQGLKKNYDQMSEGEKVALRYGFVMEKTKNAHGDFARTGGGAANQMRIFTESLKQLAASFGEIILPYFTKGIILVNQIIQAFAGLSPEVKKSIIIVAGLTATVGPLLVGFAKIKSAILTLLPVLGTLSLPVIAIGVAIVGLAAVIVRNWDEIKQTLINTSMWSTMSNIVDNALGIVIEVVDLFSNFFTGNWSGLWQNALNILKGIWNGIIETVVGGIKAIFNLQSKLFDAVGLSSMSKGLDIFIGQIDGYAKMFKLNTESMGKSADELKKKFKNFSLDFDWKSVKGNKTLSKEEAEKLAKEAFKEAQEAFARVGNKPIEFSDSLFGQLLKSKSGTNPIKKYKEEINQSIKSAFPTQEEYDNIVGQVLGGFDPAKSLQNKLDNIPIKFNIGILSTSEEINREIEDVFDTIKEKYGNLSQTTFTLLGTQIRQGISEGMKPEEAAQGVLDTFQKMAEKIKELLGDNATAEDFSKLGESMLTAMLSGMSYEKASEKVFSAAEEWRQLVKDAFSKAFNSLGDVLALGFQKIFDKTTDFKKGFKQILGGLLSGLGDMLIAYGVKLALASEVIQKAMALLPVPGANLGAALAVIALGAALKGGGMALSSSATGNTNSQLNSPSLGNKGAPSYGIGSNMRSNNQSVTFQIQGTNLVGVLQNTNLSYGL